MNTRNWPTYLYQNQKQINIMALYGYKADGTELKTQWETILYLLQSNPGRTIRQWGATKDFGFTDLAGIVKKIHYRTGIYLKRRDVKVSTRYGGTTWITEYWFEDENDK